MIGWRSRPQAAEEEKPKGFDDFDLRLGDLMRGERATLGKSLLDVQRELKIKATYIAAIENADISAFETPGFVAGYVRSYSRYLGMDPDKAFARFCAEANFTPAHGMSAQALPARAAKVVAHGKAAGKARSEFADPLANPNAAFIPRGESMLSRIEPSALGSIAVLIALVGALGYGGWSILQEVQRVQLAPVDQAPSVVVSIDPLQGEGAGQGVQSLANSTGAADADLMDRLYRPQALDVPVMVSRNGPIGTIDPRRGTAPIEGTGTGNAIEEAVAMAAAGDGVQVTEAGQQGVQILAVRPAWMRVSSADGTVLFEKILNSCESYQVPALEDVASLRTGNSGGVYFVVGGKTYGPAAPGANVASNIALSPEAVMGKYAEADLAKDRDLAKIMTADANGAIPDLAASCAAQQ